MTTVFRKTLTILDIPPTTTNLTHSFVYLLLVELDKREAADPIADVLVNPLDETLRRLSVFQDTAAYKSLALMIEGVRVRR